MEMEPFLYRDFICSKMLHIRPLLAYVSLFRVSLDEINECARALVRWLAFYINIKRLSFGLKSCWLDETKSGFIAR